MTAKDYLSQIEVKDAVINNLMKQVSELREMMYSLGGGGDSGDRVQSSGKYESRFESIYQKIDAKERQITEKIDDLIDFKLKVVDEINQLTDKRYISVLYEKYVECKDWSQISTDLNYNQRYLQHVHGQALIEFYKKHEKELTKNESF